MMSECRVLHCDGTFKTCPRPFKQVTFVQYIVAEQPDPVQGIAVKIGNTLPDPYRYPIRIRYYHFGS